MKKFLSNIFSAFICVFIMSTAAHADYVSVVFRDCSFDTCTNNGPFPDLVDISGSPGNWTWPQDFTGFSNIGANANFNGFNMRESCDDETQILWIDENGAIVYASTDFDPSLADRYYDSFLSLYPCYVDMPVGETYNVTYSCGTGSGTPPAAETATANRNFTPPTANTTCSKSGYTITGWAVSGTNDVKTPGTEFKWTYDEDKTLTAQWTADSVVTYSCGTGATGTPPANATGHYGQTFTPAANPCSKSGYVFVGWAVSNTNDIFGGPFTWNYSGDKTLTAQWATDGEFKFSVTTINMSANTTFDFAMTATGTFYIDWGDGSGDTIVRTDTTQTTYSHTYTSSGAKTIRFGGTATGYNTGTLTAAITFYNLGASKIASVTGNMSAVFPWLSGNTASGAAPRFYQTFFGATNLTSISGTLFSGYTTGADYMFRDTFNSCAGLTSIPGNLFSGITTGASYMFDGTFKRCSKLTTIPGNLFSNITTGAIYMFGNTFSYCTSLTTIPSGLFSNITTGASQMFDGTFSDCSKLTSIPGNLFSGITTGAGYMFRHTFSYCTSLTTIPSGLFSNITTTTGANFMFHYTFSGCSKLTSIPGNLFSGITTGAYNMFSYTFSFCTSLTSIPSGLFSNITTTTGASYMFSYTFCGCSKLTSIPGNLFSGITTGASYMFIYTFYGCTGLTSIPGNLFSNITTGADYMFGNTFQGCTGLTTIPSGLFSNITTTTGANGMFYYTFYGCTGLTSIPGNLFSGITTGAGYMFGNTFQGCTGLTSIPENLFSNITTGESNMFYYTFYGCTNIKGYIPPSTFKKGMGSYSNMWYNTFYNTQLVTECPTGTTQYITGYEGSNVRTTWNGKVSCEPDPGSSYAIIYEINDGTNYNNAPTTYTYGTGATVSGIPTRTNYVFGGWCVDSGYTSCAMSQTISSAAIGDKTFYAKWTQCESCAATNASCSSSVVNNACTYTTSCNTGYDNIQNNGAYNASCTPNTITINWDDGNGGYTSNTCTYGGSITTPTDAPTKRGHIFTGWVFNTGN